MFWPDTGVFGERKLCYNNEFRNMHVAGIMHGDDYVRGLVLLATTKANLIVAPSF